MIKTYKKIATIKAEQFDGSEEMIEKYKIFTYDNALGLYLPTSGIGEIVHQNDWIATGIHGEHWAIVDDIFKATYEEV